MRIEKEGCVVVRLNDQYPMCFERCSIYYDDKEYRMNGFEHLGYTKDSMVVSTDLLEVVEIPEFDFRYSVSDSTLGVYMFVSGYMNVFFENNGGKSLILKIGKAEYVLEAGPYSYLILPGGL